jgi:hypothetical protein
MLGTAEAGLAGEGVQAVKINREEGKRNERILRMRNGFIVGRVVEIYLFI